MQDAGRCREWGRYQLDRTWEVKGACVNHEGFSREPKGHQLFWGTDSYFEKPCFDCCPQIDESPELPPKRARFYEHLPSWGSL